MPLSIGTKHPFKDDEIVVAVDGLITTIAGREIVIRKGEELRGDHPAVRRLGADRFVRKGDPDALMAARLKIIDDTGDALDRREEELHRDHRQPDIGCSRCRPRPAEETIPLEHRLVVLRAFTFSLGQAIATHGRLEYAVGSVVDRRVEKIAQLAEQYPGWFAVRLDWTLEQAATARKV